MTTTKRAKLGDVCQIKWGDTSKTKASYVESGFPAFSASGCDGLLPYFDHEGPGIVLSAIGAQCGKTWFADGRWSCIKNTIFLKAKPEYADTRYLYYQTKLPDIWPIRGAAQPFISQTDARGIQISLPDLPTQRKIAGILSAYDDLIENNLRRIKILEQMAQSLYREWFVHFRFPGHESATFKDSELGRIPEGWEVIPMGEFVHFKSGFAFKSKMFTDEGEHRLVTIKNVQDGVFDPDSNSRMDELPAKLPGYCVLEDGDILLSLTGNVGRICLVYAGPFLLNQRVAKLQPAYTFDWMLAYCVFRSPEMRTALEMLSNGVAQQNLSPVQAAKMDFGRPPIFLRERFAAIAEPIGRHIVQLYNANKNLRSTRDLLLPKLLVQSMSRDV